MSRTPIILNAFNMNSVGHINHGLWTHPRDQSSHYHTLEYWTDLARELERGLFDGLFIADIVGVYDTYGQSAEVTLRESVQLPINDPTLVVPAMAAVTQYLGFGVTVNLSYEQPYLLARRFSTLDHLTRGRVGWNIVTGYLDSAARAMGQPQQLAHDERYDRADEFLDVLYQLWEGSWADDAVRRDRTQRIFADPRRVRPVQHHGRYFDVEGYHLAEPSPQRTPVLFQAGSSGRGLRFAARHAECVFMAIQDKAATAALVRQLREEVVRAGRQPGDVKVLVGITPVVGRTPRDAEEKYREYCRHASPEAALAHLAATAGIDFSAYQRDTPLLAQHKSNGIENSIRRLAGGREHYTLGNLLDELALGGRYATVVGDAGQIAGELQSWVDEAGVDGFNIARTVVPESFTDFIDLVVPELQSRGLHKRAYEGGTLRHKLFGQGDRLPARHPVDGWRFRAAAPSLQPEAVHP
ncbi:LLM class flavin-dependent oxidoreductase [Corticibacter populi]|uniref:LLM class flavin-dependent oxidoreductase n=1 Tax=Corticibacter populi TaxID=1550736 RepID=A0A3M6QXR8_9BURK|nr:LLM class flavin-dependent oxidoreductase [Corticibacter populi]RMX07701.1 LLM class flavin-dependent oxidoreductase [Corticibacter populi]RZS30216.1 FMN-dependent oxidoreductase (nitrilotriacetate monooxygenase family) [Corticibacter populi]